MREIHAELAVAGAGPAGICAAIAAARLGIKTVLIGNRPVPGGNSSSEIRVWTRGATGAGNLYAEEMGVWGILKLRNFFRNPEGNPVFWSETLLDSLMEQENLTFFLNTELSEIELSEENKVLWIGGMQQGTELFLKIHADYFIDATGDGRLGAQAGIPFYMGNRLVENADDAEAVRDANLQGNTILYNTRKENHPVHFVPPDYAYSMREIEKILGQGGRVINEKMSGSDCWWFEYGGVLDTIKDAQEITLELKRLVMGVWNYIKNSGKFDADNYTLDWIGNLPGKRESRRMCTEYMLSEKDVREQRTFDDGAFYGGWYIDFHPPGGIKDTEKENCTQIPVGVYQIPLRCLYNHKISNLLFAGRDIGTQQGAFASSRVMNTCALSGQAAGTMAAVCLRQKDDTSCLHREQIHRIQAALLREDMLIPGIGENPKLNEAVSAHISASSWHTGKPHQEAGTLSLENGGFLTAPGCAGKWLVWNVFSNAEQTSLHAKLCLEKLPSRFSVGATAETYQFSLGYGNQTVGILLPKEAEGMFCKLVFDKTPDAALILAETLRTGFLCGSEKSAAYREPFAGYAGRENIRAEDSSGEQRTMVSHRAFTEADFEETAFYKPREILNRYRRPWGVPNQWCAAPMDETPWIQLDWEQGVWAEEIRIWFDPELSMELPSSRAQHWDESHFFAPRTEMPEQLVRDFRLEIVRDNGALSEESLEESLEESDIIYEKKDNEQRLIVIRLKEKIKIQALKLCVDRTWGKRAAAVYGIGVYQEGAEQLLRI